MPVRLESLQQLAAHPHRRRVRQGHARLRLQSGQFVVLLIVLLVADQRLIQGVVMIVVLVQLLYELLHFLHNIHAGTTLLIYIETEHSGIGPGMAPLQN